MAANRWLYSTICAPLGVTDPPRGQPLVRFRLTEADNQSLSALLQRYLRPAGDVPVRLAAAFCLFAVDTLRRKAQRGVWSWLDITAPLGASDVPDSDLRFLVAKGMAFWKRPLRKSTKNRCLYLGSLVIEAGVPTALLARSEFNDFLRQLQSDIDVYSAATLDAVTQLAHQRENRIPGPWRNDETVALSAELLLALQPVRDYWLKTHTMPQHGELAGWRDTLPLDMTEAVASRLIESLVRQERATERKLRELSLLCSRVLVCRGDKWSQRIAPSEKGILPETIISRAPFSATDAPDRVRVALDGIAFAVAEREGTKRWTWHPVLAAPVRWSFDRAADGRLLVDGQEHERLILEGGEPLDDLPWVLERDPDAADRIVFVGQGSRTTAHDTLYFAADPSLGSFEVISGSVVACGTVEGTSRVVSMITGHVLWREGGQPLAIRLRTGFDSPASAGITVVVQAPSWTVLAPLVSLGSPAIPFDKRWKGQLMWRPRHGQWTRFQGELPQGECDVALVERGEILDRRRIVVLPKQASMSLRNFDRGAEIRIEALGQTAAVILDPPSRTTADGNATTLWVPFDGLPPGSVLVQTRMPDGLDLRHRIRVPMAGGGFISSGLALQNGVSIIFPDLRSMVARAGPGDDRAELGASITVQNPRPLRLGRSYAFVDELPMARMLPEMRRLYATAGDREAEIRLAVRRNGVDGRSVRVGAFDVAVAFSPDKTHVELRDRSNTSVYRDGELAVLSLARPEQPPLTLQREAAGWALPRDVQGGPWLVVGTGKLLFRVRPSIWPGSSSGMEEPPSGLARAATVVDQVARREAYRAALHSLSMAALTPESMAEWTFLNALLALSETYAPPIFFDGLVLAAECPLLMVHWLLRAEPTQLSRLAAFEDELPFAWCLVPLACWHEAVLAQVDYFRAYGLNPMAPLSKRLADIAALCPGAMAGVWEARETLAETLGADFPPPHIGRAMLPALAQHLLGFGDPPVDCDAWQSKLSTCGDWENMPRSIEQAAPQVAAHYASSGAAPDAHVVRAIRFCRQKTPDAFDTSFVHAVLVRLARR